MRLYYIAPSEATQQGCGIPPPAEAVGGAAAFISTAFVYHEVEGDLAAEMLRVARPAGRAAILEWRPDAADQSGPPGDHRVWPDQVKLALQQAGFSQITEAWRDANAYLITAHKG